MFFFNSQMLSLSHLFSFLFFSTAPSFFPSDCTVYKRKHFFSISIFWPWLYFYFLIYLCFVFFFHRDVGLDGVGVGVLGGGGGMSGGGLGGVCGVARHTLYVWRFFYSTFLQCTSADQSINGAARVCVRACACVRSRLCACVAACVIFTENLPSLSALSALQSWGGRQKQTWW